MDQQWRTKFRELRWLQLLLGGSALFSVMMLLSLWTKLPSHEALRRPPTTPVQQTTRQTTTDLFTLVQKRRNATVTVTAKPKLLHIDDLALSDSYQHWAPVIVSECVHGMDGRAAPCIKEADKTNLVEAQELMYPAFRLKLPTFTDATMQSKWLSGGLHVDRMRISEDLQWAKYPTFQGQNMVFANAMYRGDPPPDIWSDKGCMGHDVSHASFMQAPNSSELENATTVDTLVVATSPDSWSFQHFIDRVAVVWSQAQLVLPQIEKNDTIIVTGKTPRDAIVNEVYQVMVGQHLHEPKLVAAKRLVFSCRAPLIHPFTTQRITENILQELPPPQNVAEADRNIILFLSRSRGGEAANGGRKILNEQQLFDAISAQLNASGRPEQLVYFKHDEFNGLENVATFMRDRVKIMIGPHGAAFYNSRFAQPRTALIEIVPDPKQFFVPCFWEQARLLGQDYSAHVGNTQNEENDMIVDEVHDVVRLVLDRLEYLDNSYRMEDSLGHTYAWGVEATTAR
ncbi:hypothetical protein PF005_g14611 [Phytophthora fragariae]|uniref:Glycosyltransferase 61 catalytic domain-containing protein n=2 Tax=Phytophthora fragariae TaxID=53985 RepID=A0A6A4D897_9STRA|nr:hypothetical protein PF003_g34820 [Phytophthora fragariae]KAE8933897.1 hypothetical protein PF009_g16105 [Phytophthora fragariae]KAE9001374.1 hypothetical protein PF011_g13767 [Phytophthora fragariae]KAE9101258.1 hypothetical protein PF007_g15204 [Phytophthora fragariae]KAE9101959.1 hypothetical protein PF010_g14278 [Phytophthora fragariae]